MENDSSLLVSLRPLRSHAGPRPTPARQRREALAGGPVNMEKWHPSAQSDAQELNIYWKAYH